MNHPSNQSEYQDRVESRKGSRQRSQQQEEVKIRIRETPSLNSNGIRIFKIQNGTLSKTASQKSSITQKDKNQDFSPVVVQKVQSKPLYIHYNQTVKNQGSPGDNNFTNAIQDNQQMMQQQATRQNPKKLVIRDGDHNLRKSRSEQYLQDIKRSNTNQQQTTQPQTQTVISNFSNQRQSIALESLPEIDGQTDKMTLYEKFDLPLNQNQSITKTKHNNPNNIAISMQQQQQFAGSSKKQQKRNKRIMIHGGDHEEFQISSKVIAPSGTRAQSLSPENNGLLNGASLINYYNKPHNNEFNSQKNHKSPFGQSLSNNSTFKLSKIQSQKELIDSQINTQSSLVNTNSNVRASLKQLIKSNQQTQAQLSEIANNFKVIQKQQLIETQKQQKNRFIQKISSQKELSNPQNYKIVQQQLPAAAKFETRNLNAEINIQQQQPESMKSSGVSQIQSSSRSIVPKLNLEKVMELKKIFSPDIQAQKYQNNKGGIIGYNEQIEELKHEDDFITQNDIMLANEEIQKLKNEISHKNLILSSLLGDNQDKQKFRQNQHAQSSSPPKFKLEKHDNQILPLKLKFNQIQPFKPNNKKDLNLSPDSHKINIGQQQKRQNQNKTMKNSTMAGNKLDQKKEFKSHQKPNSKIKKMRNMISSQQQQKYYDNSDEDSSKSLAYRGITERIDSRGNVLKEKELLEYSPQIKNNFFEESFYKEKMKSRQKPQNLKLINNNHRRNEAQTFQKQTNIIQDTNTLSIKNKRNSIFKQQEDIRLDWDKKNMLQKQEQIKNTLELIQGNLNMIKGFKGSQSRSNSRKPRLLEPLNINQNNNIQIQLNLNFPKIQMPTNLDPQRKAFKNSKSPPIVLRRDQVKIFNKALDPNIVIQNIKLQQVINGQQADTLGSQRSLQKDFEGLHCKIRESLYSLEPFPQLSSGRTPENNDNAFHYQTKNSQVSSAFPEIQSKSQRQQLSHRQADQNPKYEIVPNYHFEDQINIYNSSIGSNYPQKVSGISQKTATNFNRNFGSRSMPEITPRDIQFRREQGYKPSFNRQHKFDISKIVVNPELRDMEQKDRQVNQPIQLKKILNHGQISDRNKNKKINPTERDEEICNFEVTENPPPINLFEKVFRDSIPIMIVDDRTDESFKSSSNPSKTNSKTNSRLSRYNQNQKNSDIKYL